MKDIKADSVNRIIDANLNRAKEGLRVCEEITRFILGNKAITAKLKEARHTLDCGFKKLPQRFCLLKQRESAKDVGRRINYEKEFRRSDWREIFFANIQRAKESTRVLEEFFKLKDLRMAARFKNIRYEIYGIEKKAAKKISALSYFRQKDAR